MKQHNWLKKEELWLVENYPTLGPDKCAEHLKLKKTQIFSRAKKLNIKMNSSFKNILKSKIPKNCNVNPELFYSLNTKEIIYLLGLIWSDGFLNPSKNGKNHNLGVTMVKEDFDIIKPILNKIGKWNCYERKQPVATWKPAINALTNNKRIYNFLIENNYDKKSFISADKILSKIPDNLKYYFFRGLIDGDGCFYYYKPKVGSTLRQFALASTYEQDWSYFEDLCKNLGIKYNINRIKGIKNSSSILRITNKNGIKKLGEYIYQNFEIDGIGLTRKYLKYISINVNS
jgi:hypothetical protein